MGRSGKDLQITYNNSLRPLSDLLGAVKRPGEYFSSGTHETPMPALVVKGMGAVSFPVPPGQSRELVSVAERAPYGRGDETLVDEGVRKVWQIAPQRVSFGGKRWERSLKALTARVEVELGCEPRSVAAEFYKLLIYDRGGFFVAHRDTEKAPGMFGTLVVALPSAHEGGDLVVRHAGRESVVSLGSSDPGEVRYAAFYADCEHEVRPVTGGYRVCLVYNLVQTARSGLPVPPDNRQAVEGAAKLLEPWTAPDGEPRKLVYLLEHRYTQAALSFAGLKGSDAARAALLREAAARAGCALHLGLVHIQESGWAEYSGDGGYHSRGRNYRGWEKDGETEEDLDDDGDDEDFEIGEVCDGRYFIAEWRDASDRPIAFGEIPLKDDEVLPVDALSDAKPDEQHFAEATGNEGASFERTYLRASLVLWPQERFDEVCASGGLDATIARFGQLVAEAVDAGDPATAGSENARRARVHRFAKLFPEEWPQFEDHGVRLDGLLGHLAGFGDAALIETLAAPALARHYAAGRNPALAACARALGRERGRAFFAGFFAAVAPTHPGGCLDLWRRLTDGAFSGRRAELGALLDVLIAAAPKARKAAKPLRLKRFGRDFVFPAEEGVNDKDEPAPAKDPLTPEALADALGVMGRALGAPACLRYIGAMAGNTEAFAPEMLLLPMLDRLAEGSGASLVPGEAVARVWEHCATFYLERSAAPPPEPRDWAQSAKIAGSIADPLLRELQAFARDPDARERRFPAATAQRALLHRAIEQAGLDMTHVTERRGRPYTLVCTKTRATHARALRRYRSDLADMRRLLALPVAQAPDNASAAAQLRQALAAS
jgi:hypothetical protein